MPIKVLANYVAIILFLNPKDVSDTVSNIVLCEVLCKDVSMVRPDLAYYV